MHRAGISTTIYEAFPGRADDAGAWLSVAVNGLDGLRAVGLHDAVVSIGFASRNITFLSGTGKCLGVLPLGGTLEDGTVTHTMKRADLYHVLYDEAIRRGIRIEHGRRLTRVELASGGVMAEFADGTWARGDLLVGADGLHSRTRSLIDPTAPTPRYTGLAVVGGYADARPIGLTNAVGDYTMIFGKRGFFAFI